MIIDVTGIELIPGPDGEGCPGSVAYLDENGNWFGLCCDECSYALCCFRNKFPERCPTCKDKHCPHSPMCKD